MSGRVAQIAQAALAAGGAGFGASLSGDHPSAESAAARSATVPGAGASNSVGGLDTAASATLQGASALPAVALGLTTLHESVVDLDAMMSSSTLLSAAAQRQRGDDHSMGREAASAASDCAALRPPVS